MCESIFSDDFKNCKQINYETGFGEGWNKGFYLSNGNYKCIKTENCKESIYGNCISCDKDYYLIKKEDKFIKKRNQFCIL